MSKTFDEVVSDYNKARTSQLMILERSFPSSTRVSLDTMERDRNSGNFHLLKNRLTVNDEETGFDLPVDNEMLSKLNGNSLPNSVLSAAADAFTEADAAMHQARLDELKTSGKAIFKALGIPIKARIQAGAKEYTSQGRLKTPYDLRDHCYYVGQFSVNRRNYELVIYAQRTDDSDVNNVKVIPNQVQISVAQHGKNPTQLIDAKVTLPMSVSDRKHIVKLFAEIPVVKQAVSATSLSR